MKKIRGHYLPQRTEFLHVMHIYCKRHFIYRFEDNKIGIKAVWLKHRIPSYGFVIDEKPIAGK